MTGSLLPGEPPPDTQTDAQTVRGVFLHGQGLGGHNNYPAAMAALARLVAHVEKLEHDRDEAEVARRRVPSDEGGPGREETYWLKAKLRMAITHLRDIEDYYRLRGGTDESPNLIRAGRARQLYEAISDDFLNGKLDRPTVRERAVRAEADAANLREALEAFVDVIAYCHPSPNSPNAEKWGEWREAALDKAALALAGQAAPTEYLHAECSDHPGETEWPDSGCAKCREETAAAPQTGDA